MRLENPQEYLALTKENDRLLLMDKENNYTVKNHKLPEYKRSLQSSFSCLIIYPLIIYHYTHKSFCEKYSIYQ